jgi:hypothetical protein
MLRFLCSLIALALVLSPLGMSQGMAMAHAPEAVTADGHCGDSQAPADENEGSGAMLDCMGICSAIAAADEAWAARGAPATASIQAPAMPALSGLHPESEPPPPRIS